MKQEACSLKQTPCRKATRFKSGGRAARPSRRNQKPQKPDSRSVSTILRQMDAEVAMRSDYYKTKCLEKLVILALLLVWIVSVLCS